ncbi:putative tautomerase YusQ [Reticulibacter mediterranei]|uniref:Putative tautomerase YusQ n=1 Tax=Reticulibacter mediterranei TaxID=2778369 RepID=A0A8J3IQ98_9CHLR|nr:tautomerase family protein [Reticulibacter mediterranei]GHO98223.1 putative tautomerase YusQ [Reticulibacter mediterranei]
MPFIRIDLQEGRPAATVRAISDSVHRALTEHFNVPLRDRFQIITEHKAEQLIYENYLDIERTNAIVFIQIFLRAGRTVEQKRAFYARVAELLVDNAGTRPQDVFITLVENTIENWSFGNGQAQMLDLPMDQWK